MGETTNLLNNYIISMVKEKGLNFVSLTLDEYINGNQCAITRANGFREHFVRLLPSSKLKSILGGYSHQYVSSTYDNYCQYYFEKVINDTLQAKGAYYLSQQLILLVDRGSALGFVNKDYAINYLLSNVPMEKIREMAKNEYRKLTVQDNMAYQR